VKAAAWEFHCRILPTIRLSAPTLSLGVRSEKEAIIDGSINLAALADVRSLECEASGSWQIETQSLGGDGNNFQLTARSKGKLQPMEIRDTITVTAVRESGERLPPRVVMLTGKVVHDVVADPPQILLGRL